jgi:predicted glutamine amidotransferase
MCQLLGMNSNVPTDICFSFAGFQQRGGLTDVHRDGWGIAFFEGKGVRQFLDPLPSAHSPIAELVRQYPIKSKNVVAHIRKATQGDISLVNTHPFFRELWGHSWIFAHNGNLLNYQPQLNGDFLPIGHTDSEMSFCYLLQELREKFGAEPPGPAELFTAVLDLVRVIGALGEFNFLLSNGDVLLAHCSTQLSYILRKAPFASARLKDQDVEIDFSTVTSSLDRVAVIATQPLTENEQWIKFEPGTLWMFKEAEILFHGVTVAGPEKPTKTGCA